VCVCVCAVCCLCVCVCAVCCVCVCVCVFCVVCVCVLCVLCVCVCVVCCLCVCVCAVCCVCVCVCVCCVVCVLRSSFASFFGQRRISFSFFLTQGESNGLTSSTRVTQHVYSPWPTRKLNITKNIESSREQHTAQYLLTAIIFGKNIDHLGAA